MIFVRLLLEVWNLGPSPVLVPFKRGCGGVWFARDNPNTPKELERRRRKKRRSCYFTIVAMSNPRFHHGHLSEVLRFVAINANLPKTLHEGFDVDAIVLASWKPCVNSLTSLQLSPMHSNLTWTIQSHCSSHWSCEHCKSWPRYDVRVGSPNIKRVSLLDKVWVPIGKWKKMIHRFLTNIKWFFNPC